MPEPVICAYARTPVGKYRGSLSGYSATELGAMAVEELLKRAGIDPASGVIDQVYMGHVLQAGAENRYRRHQWRGLSRLDFSISNLQGPLGNQNCAGKTAEETSSTERGFLRLLFRFVR